MLKVAEPSTDCMTMNHCGCTCFELTQSIDIIFNSLNRFPIISHPLCDDKWSVLLPPELGPGRVNIRQTDGQTDGQQAEQSQHFQTVRKIRVLSCPVSLLPWSTGKGRFNSCFCLQMCPWRLLLVLPLNWQTAYFSWLLLCITLLLFMCLCMWRSCDRSVALKVFEMPISVKIVTLNQQHHFHLYVQRFVFMI